MLETMLAFATLYAQMLRYANLATLEEGYGINLVPLATFGYGALCRWIPARSSVPRHPPVRRDKREDLQADGTDAQGDIRDTVQGGGGDGLRVIPSGMEDRALLGNIDYSRGVCTVGGMEYEMKSCCFPTIDPLHPKRPDG